MSTEPVAIGTAIIGVATAILALLTGTEVITPTVSALIGGIVLALVVLVGSIVRRKVTPFVSE